MMAFRCAKCGEKIASLQEGSIIRCPSCANKILYKLRDSVAKDVKAR
jgi:DNA-directed RNA polymerase subunit RPC12/RpoP